LTRKEKPIRIYGWCDGGLTANGHGPGGKPTPPEDRVGYYSFQWLVTGQDKLAVPVHKVVGKGYTSQEMEWVALNYLVADILKAYQVVDVPEVILPWAIIRMDNIAVVDAVSGKRMPAKDHPQWSLYADIMEMTRCFSMFEIEWISGRQMRLVLGH
jgi:hypothetical protein